MILVDVYIPSVDDNFDFMLDENTEIKKIVLEISEMISKKVKSSTISKSEEFFLYHMDRELLLDKNQTLHSSGVTDGCRLMLV